MSDNKSGAIFMVAIVCIFYYPFIVVADQSILVRSDLGDGIKSKVFVFLGDKKEPKGITDDSGMLLLEKPCSQGKQIKAYPVSPLYYKGSVDCRGKQNQLVVRVSKKSFISNLKWNAENFEAVGSHGNAALAYSELATRLHKINSKEASAARNKAYASFADAIKVPVNFRVVNFDKNQGATVLTPEFVDIIRSYQNKKGLPVTGAIDYKTLSTQSDVSVFNVLFKKVTPPHSEIIPK